MKRGLWKLGVVEKLVPSKDGQVRARLIAKQVVVTESVQIVSFSKLYPSEIVDREMAMKKENKKFDEER